MKLRFLPLLTVLILLCGCTKQSNTPAESEKHITIALLDTGVASSVITSEHLKSGYNYVTENEDTEDLINHGTAIASILLGCESLSMEANTQDVDVVPMVIVTKENNATVSVTPSVLAKAIRDSIDLYHADIINISLGIQTDDPDLAGAIDYAEQQGVLVVAAVGNNGDDGIKYFPASYDSVVAVGSCDKENQKSDFSQSGADVLARGEDLKLASRNGNTYVVKGTSFSTGFVSAYCANYLSEHSGTSAEELRKLMTEMQMI